MARPDNMSTHTPIDPDRCTCYTSIFTGLNWGQASCPKHGKSDDDIVGELQETCRVLTELAQQLTNAIHAAIVDDADWDVLQGQLDAAAELGITPQP